MSTTTVRIDKETRDMLKEVGSKGQTYDEIIQEMLELRRIFIEDLYSILEETEEDEWLTTEELRKELEWRFSGVLEQERNWRIFQKKKEIES